MRRPQGKRAKVMTKMAYSGQSERDLRGKLAEVGAENFKAAFTSEARTPQKGAQIRERRREVARVLTVLTGRRALARREAEVKQLELRLSGMGKAHEGTPQQKRLRAQANHKLEIARRAVRELGTVRPQAEKAGKK